MAEHRHVRLFRNGRNQAVQIPVEFELPGDEAIMHLDGDRLVIEPVRKRGLAALLETMKPIEERFPEIDDPVACEGRPVPVSLQEILEAFEFAGMSGSLGAYRAILCRRTGKIYRHAELSDLEEFNDELPDDVEDEEKYIDIPDKRELGLGKPLVLDFAREVLPGDFDEVRYMFSKKGGYRKFRAMVIRRKVLQRWYDFESQATKRALREWCEVNSIEVTG